MKMNKDTKVVPAEETGLEFVYYDKTKTVTVVGLENRDLTEVVIPDEVLYKGNVYTVTEIGFFSLSECTNLTNIEIPNSVTYIGGWAFWCCKNLRSARVPATLKGKVESEFPTTCEIEFY